MPKLKYKFLDEVATADIAFEAYGKDCNELFENAALALESVMVRLDSIRPLKTRNLKVKGESVNELLFSFLEELVFQKDAESMIFSEVRCKVEKVKSKKYKLNVKLKGEEIDYKQHKLGVDVKAVTKHLFKIIKVKSGQYKCRVVLDV